MIDIRAYVDRLRDPDPEFDAWVATIDKSAWAKIDLSALRIGWMAANERSVGEAVPVAPVDEIHESRCEYCGDLNWEGPANNCRVSSGHSWQSTGRVLHVHLPTPLYAHPEPVTETAGGVTEAMIDRATAISVIADELEKSGRFTDSSVKPLVWATRIYDALALIAQPNGREGVVEDEPFAWVRHGKHKWFWRYSPPTSQSEAEGWAQRKENEMKFQERTPKIIDAIQYQYPHIDAVADFVLGKNDGTPIRVGKRDDKGRSILQIGGNMDLAIGHGDWVYQDEHGHWHVVSAGSFDTFWGRIVPSISGQIAEGFEVFHSPGPIKGVHGYILGQGQRIDNGLFFDLSDEAVKALKFGAEINGVAHPHVSTNYIVFRHENVTILHMTRKLYPGESFTLKLEVIDV